MTTALGAANPAFLDVVRGNRRGAGGRDLAAGHAVLVDPEGCLQVAFNLAAGLVIGSLAEQVSSRVTWIVLFLAGAMVGHAAGIFWQPTGSGSSVAIAGCSAACWRSRSAGPACRHDRG